MKKITDWMLEKEEEAAKQCAVPVGDIQKQLDMLEKKKQKFTRQYDATMKEFDHIEEKLQEMIRTEKLRCSTEKKS